jgi:hypothetical protein
MQRRGEAVMKILSAAMKLSVQERVRVAEKLLESADAEDYEEDSEAAIHAAWPTRSGDVRKSSRMGPSAG